MRFGYARVSTTEQDTALQVRLFGAAGVDVFFEDSVSGVKKRPELEALLGYLEAGDELVVYKVDRVARSLGGLLAVLEVVGRRGARFRSLTEPFDTSTLTGRLMLQMLGAFAEFERGMIVERVSAGMAAARDRGVKLGRNRQIDYQVALQMRLAGSLMREIGAVYGVTRAGVWRALRVARAECVVVSGALP
jgi:DNA invertase Pin-like site-specific DNA recombinase